MSILKPRPDLRGLRLTPPFVGKPLFWLLKPRPDLRGLRLLPKKNKKELNMFRFIKTLKTLKLFLGWGAREAAPFISFDVFRIIYYKKYNKKK